MGIVKKEIFIASRFEEFKEIREKLNEKIKQYSFIEAIDLNDNKASHRSPLADSLFHVRKSEIMLLLVGETYGTIPEGETKSYTHLEYEEAIQDSSNTRVLVFCIGPSYSGKFINYSNDTYLKSWQIQLENNHRLSKFGDETQVEMIAEKIMIMLLSSLYDLNPTEELDFDQDKELYIEINQEDEENFLFNDEVAYLDSQQADIKGIDVLVNNDEHMDTAELLKIPAKLAALEQKKEAQKAIELQDYSTAIKHLRKAFEYISSDFESNYWLAKLYVVSAKKSLYFEIEEYLHRAAKIAQKENSYFRASHCYLLIAQAAMFSEKENEGLKYLELAEELTPSFARLHLEKAKFLLYFDHLEKGKNSLMQAINIKMDMLKDIAKDPFFKQYKPTINELKEELRSHLYKSCYAIASQTNSIKQALDISPSPIDLKNLSIYELWVKARHDVQSQYRLISTQMQNVSDTDITHIENEMADYNIYIESQKELELKEKTLKAQAANDENEKNIKNLNDNVLSHLKNIEKGFNEVKQSYEDTYNEKKESIFNVAKILIVFIIIMLIILFFGTSSSGLIAFTLLLISGLIPLVRQLNKYKGEKNSSMNQLIETYIEDKRKSELNIKINIENLKKNLESFNKNLDEKFEDQLAEITTKLTNYNENSSNRIKELLEYYSKIASLFQIFESTTVSKSTSKFIPFRSLNNSKTGSIIRITPQSYSKYIESGRFLEIKDDLPSCLKLNKVEPEQISFLAKVIQKNKNSMTVSRIKAYI